jgi:N-acetylneuraminic acid mutarotase
MPRRALAAWLALAAAAIAGAAIGWSGGSVERAQAAPWTRAPSMPQRRSYLAAAQIGDRIYTAGGMVGETGRPVATFARFDAVANQWAVLEPLPVPTRAAAAAALGGSIYVIGGTTPAGNTASVYAYDGRWRVRARMPAPRFNHSAVALAGKIYVLGGFLAGEERDEVFVYDASANRWSQTTPLPRPTHAFDAVAFGGEIWMIGGRRGGQILREVWIFDPETAEWRSGPAMSSPMELLGAAVVGDEIHAITESTYQIYDALSRQWSVGPTPLVPRHALQTFYANGALYTLGGCTTALHDSPVVERRELRT